MSSSRWKNYILVPIVLTVIRQLIIYLQDPSEALQRVESRLQNISKINLTSNSKSNFNHHEIVISAVACGGHERLEELSVMMKSAIIFSQSKPLKFLIFTDNLALEIEKLLDFWKPYFKKGLSWDIRPVLYPPLSKDQIDIKSKFAPCATQRLFFPQILPEYKYILYVDTDIIFLQDTLHIWNHIQNMDGKSFGLVTENDESFYSLYSYSMLPHPKNGLNSGVMLMNLENMRNQNWNDKMLTIFEELKSSMAFCDQDIINVYSYYYSTELVMLPCSANYRPDFCLSSQSNSCSIDSILMLHGNRAAFHTNHWQFGESSIISWLFKVIRDNYFTKNIKFLDYGFAVWNVVMTKSEVFPIVYQTVNEFKVGTKDLKILKQVLKQKFNSVTSRDLCYHIKDSIINMIP